MKTFKFISILALAAVTMIACSEKNSPSGPVGPGGGGDDKVPTPIATIDTTKAISLDSAIAKANLDEEVVIKGYVAFAYNTKTENGQIKQSAWIAEKFTDNSGKIQAYWCVVTDSVMKGDYVAVQGKVSSFSKDNSTEYEIKDGVMQFIRKGQAQEIDPSKLEGDGSPRNPYTVADVLMLNNTQKGPFYIKGIVVGQVKNGSAKVSDAEFEAPFSGKDGVNTNILIAATAGEKTIANIVPVQLPSGMRDFSLPAVPGNLGKELLVYGTLETFFGQAGIKGVSYAEIDGKTYGAKPMAITGNEKLNETLLTQASFDKFTVVNVSGDLQWTFDEKYGAKMSGYDDAQKKTFANEDWFISPAFDATGGATLTFEHARGPKGSMNVSTDNYIVLVSNDFSGDVTTATWTPVAIPTHGTTAWGYVSSGAMAIPTANCAANCRIAWKYVCDDSESATWEIKNIIVK